MDLDRARALAASDSPVSADTMGRAQLVVLLAILDRLGSAQAPAPVTPAQADQRKPGRR